MESYIELKVDFEVIPHYPPTEDDPGEPGGIEIIRVDLEGDDVLDLLTESQIEKLQRNIKAELDG